MGYHTREFKKGVFGEFSKVQEEWEELLDARLQDGKILELCEIADLYGALEGYLEKAYNISMADVAKMSRMTQTAFLEGKRVSSEAKKQEDWECCKCQLPALHAGPGDLRECADGKVYCDWCASHYKVPQR